MTVLFSMLTALIYDKDNGHYRVSPLVTSCNVHIRSKPIQQTVFIH